MLRRRIAALLALLLSAGGAGAAALLGARSSGPVAPARAQPGAAAPAVPRPDRVRLTFATRRPTAGKLPSAEPRRPEDRIVWRRSRALGVPHAGRLVNGVLLPSEGRRFFTWDPVRWTSPNPESRRAGTDRLVRTILEVLARYAAANATAPRVAIGDLSRPGGGSFDARYGILREFGRGRGTLGHVSHQNGLDLDVYYPRLDRRERAPDSPRDVDRRLAQELVDGFVAAGAQFVFVGPGTGLRGPPAVVQALARHDDHLHVRLTGAR